MLFKNFFFILQFIILSINAPCLNAEHKKYAEINLSSDEGLKIYQRWVENAYSGLIAALANQRINKKPDELTKFGNCAKNAATVPQHAQCLQAIHTYHCNKKKSEIYSDKQNYSMVNNQSVSSLSAKQDEKKKDANWIGEFRLTVDAKTKQKNRLLKYKRMKRGILDANIIINKTANNYKLLTPNVSPIGSVAKMLTKIIVDAKGKSNVTLWRETIAKLQTIREKAKNGDFFGINRNSGSDNSDEEENFRIFEDEKLFSANSQVLKNKKPNAENKLVQLIRDGIKLSYGLTGKNMSDIDISNIRFASPRFLSVSPENDNDNMVMKEGINQSNSSTTNGTKINNAKQKQNMTTINLISPSLFSLHSQGSGLEKELSLPNLFKEINDSDQNNWLNLILELSGTNDCLEMLEGKKTNLPKKRHWSNLSSKDLAIDSQRYQRDVRNPETGQPLYFTKNNATEIIGENETRKMDTYEKLFSSLSMKQWKEMNATGYTVMTSKQIKHFYGLNSPYNSSDAIRRLSKKSRKQLMHNINFDLYQTSKSKSFELRLKDVVNSPSLFAPSINTLTVSSITVLSPLAFSPFIQSPNVLGPLILSPWIFSPLIVSPHVMTPMVLSPFLFSPQILSPLVLEPSILTPGLFSPFILTPFVLSPGILSPVVFSPLILSPSVLTPRILVPSIGSPLILSPFVLTPIILSPQALSGLFLSPYALSPVILSPLSLFLAILSPSWLS